MEASEETLDCEQPGDYELPKLVELGSVYELTRVQCIDEHGSPLHPFCASV
jgi:hypothetical protein